MTFPYNLSLGKNTSGTPLLPFRVDDTLGEKIVVTQSYDQMYHRLMRLCMSGAHRAARRRCVSMTRSSPHATTHRHIRSLGKTTFLKFMLARLISARQVVVLCDNNRCYLFYAGTVYSRPAEFGFVALPTHKESEDFPVWALIDLDFQERGPQVGSANVWAIQTSSPNPIRWKSWRKQHRAALLGMPLWSMEELMKGYAFCLFSLAVVSFVADCRSPLQFQNSSTQRISERTGEISLAS